MWYWVWKYRCEQMSDVTKRFQIMFEMLGTLLVCIGRCTVIILYLKHWILLLVCAGRAPTTNTSQKLSWKDNQANSKETKRDRKFRLYVYHRTHLNTRRRLERRLGLNVPSIWPEYRRNQTWQWRIRSSANPSCNYSQGKCQKSEWLFCNLSSQLRRTRDLRASYERTSYTTVGSRNSQRIRATWEE